MNTEQLAAALSARKAGPATWSAKCPAHDDKTPSLSITESATGQTLVHCHAGCEQETVIGELKARGLWSNGSHNDTAERMTSTPRLITKPSLIPLEHSQLGPYVRHWDYQDANGNHVLRVCRWDTDKGKEIRPLSLHADGWHWKQVDDSRPLYRLCDLLKRPRDRVLIIEGEKAADAAAKWFPDLVATTWAGGAKASGKTDWRPLHNRDVTLLADNDDPGTAAMDQVAELLKAHSCTVRRVDLAKLAPLAVGWDIADAEADKSFDIERLWEQVENAPVIHGKAHSLNLRQAADIVSNPIPAAWLLRPYLEQMVLALMFGEMGTLKSFVTLDMLLSIAAGKSWAGSKFKPKPQAVVYVSAEGKGLSKRLQAWSLHHGHDLHKIPFYAVEHALNLSNPAGILELVEAIEALKIQPAVIGIDTLSRNSGPLDENSSADMGAFINALDQHLRQRLKCSVLLVHHTGHMAKDRARGSYALMASTDAWFKVERPDPEAMAVKFTTGRLKDSDSPPAIYLKANVVDLGSVDEDGQPETSLVLLPSDETIPDRKRPPTGKQQVALLKLLESEHTAGNHTWPIGELRRLSRDRCGMTKTTAQSVVAGLVSAGFLHNTIGGLALTDPPIAGKQS